MQKNKSKTIFCDLDGTLVEHNDPISIQDPNLELKVLPGTHDKWPFLIVNILRSTSRLFYLFAQRYKAIHHKQCLSREKIIAENPEVSLAILSL